MPFPIATRIFYDARYMYENKKDEEYLALFSGAGNEEFYRSKIG